MGTGLAVSHLVRDIQLPYGAFGHQLKDLCPTGDDLVEAEDGRLAAVV
jgi:hypothetical protein